MNARAFLIAATAALFSVKASTIDFDTVKPFIQPKPVTVSEKAAIKFKPRLVNGGGCVPFPAVNEAGDTSNGVPWLFEGDKCQAAPLGGQVYGRAGWYNDVWASIAVVWINNPAVENPKVMGISYSLGTNTNDYEMKVPVSFANGTTPVLGHYNPDGDGVARLRISNSSDGDFQDLIMWEQLTDAARAGLNNSDSNTYVPVSDENFFVAALRCLAFCLLGKSRWK
ncbi:unnamed protein product [Phytophthora lilii]|uniref:Unnamed protein product n=1 Tax=Phytophthora lilii TaxID=2077276 RepID=A0A9W6YIJ5_9STRA|nr:unnamed protein product [Phytophthora lilii]